MLVETKTIEGKEFFTAKMCKILSNVGGLILGYIEADLGEYSLINKSFCSLFKFYKICAFVYRFKLNWVSNVRQKISEFGLI